MSGKYDDIINLPHPTSKKHPRMSRQNRAAQFSPFAALTGYEAEIREIARQTEKKKQLSEDQWDMLNEKIMELLKLPHKPVRAVVTYFVPDPKKEGGTYRKKDCYIDKISMEKRVLLLENKEKIFFDEIWDIEF
ncbi:YolD-like family protein [Anaerotignum lactatifermentans]